VVGWPNAGVVAAPPPNKAVAFAAGAPKMPPAGAVAGCPNPGVGAAATPPKREVAPGAEAVLAPKSPPVGAGAVDPYPKRLPPTPPKGLAAGAGAGAPKGLDAG